MCQEYSLKNNTCCKHMVQVTGLSYGVLSIMVFLEMFSYVDSLDWIDPSHQESIIQQQLNMMQRMLALSIFIRFHVASVIVRFQVSL